jgi:PAS domain S-box-containing protein
MRPGAPSRTLGVVSGLHEVRGDIAGAIESISVPSYVIDPAGTIRWVNAAAIRIVGDVRGRQLTSVVAPEDRLRARERFARKIAGKEKVTDGPVVLYDARGERIQCEISSVQLLDGHRVVGVFGQVSDVAAEPPPPPPSHLTPRQADILRLLQLGASTDQMALELQLSKDTVRNHVRHLLKALGVHTRLEAVAHTSTRGSILPRG